MITSKTSPHMRARVAATLLTCVFAALCFIPAASANPDVGIGDNGPAMFLDPNFRALNTNIARKIVPYDFFKSPAAVQDLRSWVTNATALGIEPLISLEHSHVKPKKLPGIGEYKKSLGFLRKNFPNVTSLSPWNEANHVSQPTWNKPERAAEYFKATQRACPQCKIVAADVLDQKNMLPWLDKFKQAAGPRANIWGLHSYADSNKDIPWGKSATKKMLGAVNGKIWLTEVGGIVAFKDNFVYNEKRAAKAVVKTLTNAKKSPRIERVYLYCWFGAVQPPMTPPYIWDSGLVSASGALRPSYGALTKWLAANGGSEAHKAHRRSGR